MRIELPDLQSMYNAYVDQSRGGVTIDGLLRLAVSYAHAAVLADRRRRAKAAKKGAKGK